MIASACWWLMAIASPWAFSRFQVCPLSDRGRAVISEPTVRPKADAAGKICWILARLPRRSMLALTSCSPVDWPESTGMTVPWGSVIGCPSFIVQVVDRLLITDMFQLMRLFVNPFTGFTPFATGRSPTIDGPGPAASPRARPILLRRPNPPRISEDVFGPADEWLGGREYWERPPY